MVRKIFKQTLFEAVITPKLLLDLWSSSEKKSRLAQKVINQIQYHILLKLNALASCHVLKILS